MTTVRLKTRVCEQRPSWARSPVRVGRKGRAPAATPAPESLASMVQARRASSPVRIRPPTRRYMYDDRSRGRTTDGSFPWRAELQPPLRLADQLCLRRVCLAATVALFGSGGADALPSSQRGNHGAPAFHPRLVVTTTRCATEALVQTTRGDKSDLSACIAGDAPSVAVAEAPPPWAASSSRRSSGLGSLSASSREADAAPPPWCASQPDPARSPPEV